VDERYILIPVKCPQCGATEQVAFSVDVVVTAVTAWGLMRLFATCHEVAWDASVSEIQSIREHLGDQWLKSSLAHQADVGSSVVGITAATGRF
jgi:hypothetical protein